jgi:hypothetical protein
MVDLEESVTRTTESGAFIRTIIRKGKKRHQDTKRVKKSDKKVTLGWIGEFEVYVYPYDFPDTVFIGKFPVSTQIQKGTENGILNVAQKIRHYLEGAYFNKPNWRKGANARKRAVKQAYNKGLNDARGKKNPTIN